MDERIMVLLGAGASVEAGLPTSTQLTQRIVEDISRSSNGAYRGLSPAINFAIGALIAHDTARGGDAFAGVDVERLFAAVRMLSDRDNLEIAPFVSAWSDGLRFMRRKGRMPAFFKDNFSRALTTGSGTTLDRLFADAVRAVVNEATADEIFAELGGDMIGSLRGCLDLDGSSVDYLAPLLARSDDTTTIATLNYDRSIELLAGRAGLDLTTGIDLWSGGYDWDWEAGKDVYLLKLHGSLDWRIEMEQTENGMAHEVVRSFLKSDNDGFQRLGAANLGVIFGQREKLRADGPFLAMLREFGEMLKTCERLVVVGYSFRDDHINAAIRRWFTDRPKPKVTLIDPMLADEQWVYSRISPFLKELLRAMREGYSNEFKPEHQLLGVGAGAGLRQVFGDGPELQPVDIVRHALASPSED
ncbi:SIR2 family protein [Kribbella sp. NPDC051936]|uniref:SIR2 family protein n=1 Tax=Kribbella sp. NPDC051936 TaxID=3154946 RepID=UPI00343E0C01